MAQIFLPSNWRSWEPPHQPAVRTVSKVMLSRPSVQHLRSLMDNHFGPVVIDSTDQTVDPMGGLMYTVTAGDNKLQVYVPSDALVADNKVVPTFNHQLWDPIPATVHPVKVIEEHKKVFTDIADKVLPDPAIVPKRRFNFEDDKGKDPGDVPHRTA